MTALLLHIIWSIAYLTIFIIFNIIVLIFFKNKLNKIKNYSNNYFLKLLFIIFFNKNLLLFKNVLNTNEIELIEIERLKNWPMLNFIHSNINKISKDDLDIGIDFKHNYKTFNFIEKNLNLENIFNKKLNNKIYFSIISVIVKNNFKIKYKNDFLSLLVALIIFKNSLSTNKIKVNTYNLSKLGDYMNYINNSSLAKNLSKKQIIINNVKINNFNTISTDLGTYSKYVNLNNLINYKNNYFYLKNFNKFLNLNIEFCSNFINNLSEKYSISFSASNIVKYISDYSVNNSVILYLRKNKIFNKSRYSRNRQTYRTGAYWCLYINIIAVVAFYFWFYKFTMNFGYLWWLLYAFILSFFLSRAIKHRFYNPNNIILEFNLGFKWLILIILSIIKPIVVLLKSINNWLYFNTLVKLYQINNFSKLLKNINIEILYLQQSFNWINTTNRFVMNYINKFIL